MTGASIDTVFDRAVARTSPIHFWHSKDRVDTWSATTLLALAANIASRFTDAGVRPGKRVALCLQTSPDLIASIIAAWGCGATVLLLPYRTSATLATAQRDRLPDILQVTRPEFLVHDDCFPASVASLVQTCLKPHTFASPDVLFLSDNHKPASFPAKPGLQNAALIQMTSGSSGIPKGIEISHFKLAVNCAGIAERSRISETDHQISWLPMNHDMGLAAFTLPTWMNASITLISPERFTNSPLTWLEALSSQKGTLSPNPAFAYALLTKYAKRFKPGDIDLSSWRFAWAGAEPVFDAHLRAFYDAFSPFGLRETVLKPSFGMAEAVVAVTCDYADRPYLALHVDAAMFRYRGRVNTVTVGTVGALRFVSNGAPLSGMRIKIVDEAGHDLGESQEGRLLIAGESVATGYLENIDSEKFDADGWFDTGDLGFVVDGDLYITGRAKDLIIRGGMNISPQHIEWEIEQLLALRPGQVAAFSVIDTTTSREEVVVVVGKKLAPAQAGQVTIDIARMSAARIGLQIDRVIFTASGNLPRTTSGKVQRSVARKMYLNNDFDQSVLEPNDDRN